MRFTVQRLFCVHKLFLTVIVFALLVGTASAAMSDADFLELCKEGTVQQIVDAIKNGANVNARGEYGQTPLMWAAEHNPNPEVTATLLKEGADINANDKREITALMRTVRRKNSNLKVITTLLKAGANVNARDRKGATPLSWAAALTSNPEVITTLVKAGADVNARDDMGGSTPFMSAARHNSNPEVIVTLIKAGADVNARGDNGGGALMWAAANTPNPEVITALVKAGADVNASDNAGNTPLTLAVCAAAL